MKLTNKARNELRRVLSNMERSRAYLDRPDIVVAKVTKHPLTRDYVSPELGALKPLTKWAGSELATLDTAIDELAAFLVHN